MPLIRHQGGKGGYAKENEETDGDKAEEDMDRFGVEPQCPIPIRDHGLNTERLFWCSGQEREYVLWEISHEFNTYLKNLTVRLTDYHCQDLAFYLKTLYQVSLRALKLLAVHQICEMRFFEKEKSQTSWVTWKLKVSFSPSQL